MKALGIVRKIDELGRVVIPKEVRRTNGWETNQPMEMFAVEGGLYIKAYGEDAEKKEIMDQLQHLQKTTDNQEVLNIISNTIKFLKSKED